MAAIIYYNYCFRHSSCRGTTIWRDIRIFLNLQQVYTEKSIKKEEKCKNMVDIDGSVTFL